MINKGRLESRRERLIGALAGYGTALVLLGLTLVVDAGGDARRYLIVSALIITVVTTAALLASLKARRN
ncbi:hypothetical protein [Blastococcus saxobsidens]|uniref:hypothetical protein n=1 Tax=Blastococcus saxobsidens TaxID=138336 RepID=UPI00102B83AC|nr:hypothetical protein [Blastococcus saxobsidens]